jgi:hypothetical protein
MPQGINQFRLVGPMISNLKKTALRDCHAPRVAETPKRYGVAKRASTLPVSD